mmetsp:Transcript_30664/g.66944  ORF Transcript_30664/g.66944 Transcript_30664/m.66944 type:complete len:317 (+) Transcript_30664:328-1278(+)
MAKALPALASIAIVALAKALVTIAAKAPVVVPKAPPDAAGAEALAREAVVAEAVVLEPVHCLGEEPIAEAVGGGRVLGQPEPGPQRMFPALRLPLRAGVLRTAVLGGVPAEGVAVAALGLGGVPLEVVHRVQRDVPPELRLEGGVDLDRHRAHHRERDDGLCLDHGHRAALAHVRHVREVALPLLLALAPPRVDVALALLPVLLQVLRVRLPIPVPGARLAEDVQPLVRLRLQILPVLLDAPLLAPELARALLDPRALLLDELLLHLRLLLLQAPLLLLQQLVVHRVIRVVVREVLHRAVGGDVAQPDLHLLLLTF